MTKIAAKPAPVPEVRKEVRTLKKRQHRKKTLGVEKNTEAIPAFDWAGVELKEFRKSFVDVSAYNTACRKYNDESLRKYYNDAEARTLATTPPVTAESGAVTPVVSLKPPMVTFTQTPFPASIHTELKRQGFDKPHPIFAITWPHILSGQNFCGVAQSGPWSLAYVLPCLVHVNDQLVKAKGVEVKTEDFGPVAVVVTHSQARGEQLLEQFQKFGALLNITTQLVYGEKPDDMEADPHAIALKENPNVVIVACGPKMTELILKKKLSLKRCTFLVFDDATLLHKFGRSLENVLGQVRPDRQLVMWNTTFGSSNGNAQEAIKQAKKFNFVDYMRVFFGTYNHFFNPNTVKHVVDFFIPDGERDLRFMLTIQTILTAAAASAKKPNILVFCNTLAKSRKACDALQRTGILSKAFQTRNPIPHPVNENNKSKTTTTTTAATKPAAAAPTPAEKEEGGDESVTEEKPANAEPVTFEQQLEINQREFSENKLYQVWIANDANPLAELDFSEFDCIVHYDFPARHELYEERAAKFQEEAGRGAVYTLILESSDHQTTKYLSNYLLAHNQYCSPRLAVEPNQRARIKPADSAQKAATGDAQKKQETPKNQAKKPADNKVGGKPGPNRPPSLLQKQNRGTGPYTRPFAAGGGGGPRNGGGRFGGPGGPGGPGNFQSGPGPFGGNNRQNFNRGGGGGGNFGGGNQPNVMDALQLLNQLRNNGGGGGDNDDSFYNRRAPKQDNFNNDFGGNFGGGNRGGNSFNSGGPRNNFGGGGNSGNGGGWFKEDGQNRNFNNNWNNRNF